MSLDFYPFTLPDNKSVIKFPQQEKEIKTPINKKSMKKKEREKVKINFDIEKVTLDSSKKSGGYTIQELKAIAKSLKIKGSSTMKRADLVKFIKLKVKN